MSLLNPCHYLIVNCVNFINQQAQTLTLIISQHLNCFGYVITLAVFKVMFEFCYEVHCSIEVLWVTALEVYQLFLGANLCQLSNSWGRVRLHHIAKL